MRIFNLAGIVAALLAAPQWLLAEEQLMYVASPGSPSVIYACSLDLKTGAFGELRSVAEVRTGFLALHPTKLILYAATSEKVGKDEPNGAVRAYRIQEDGGLKQISRAPTNDRGTTHIEVSKDGKAVLVCHYGGAGTSAIPLSSNGKTVAEVSQIAHEGASADPKRQTRPHPHGIAIDQASRFACVADLGNDHVEVFRLGDGAKLARHGHWKAKPGAGPRHVSFHPNGKWLYCINELDSTLDVLDFNRDNGKLTGKQTISTLPSSFEGSNSTAEVVVHPSGKFLYGSNRGHDSTAVFAINQDSGKLTLVQHEPTQGDHPRFVGLDPSGSIYLAANLHTNNIVSFRVHSETGKLTPTGNVLQVPRPMCVVFPEK